MEIKDIERVYFVGIGGIGMAALARYFLSLELPVAGYDRTPSALTAELEHEGAVVSFDDSMAAVPDIYLDAKGTLVVYTPAVPESNIPLTYFRQHGFEVRKRAYVLGQVSRHSRGICFAGTHGKTTTSSMAAHILHCGIGCNAFLGGVLKGYNTNLMLSPGAEYCVMEADEYDRSFHQLSPYIAVITATDPDHLDIYGTEEAYLESFAHFTELIVPGGALVVREGLKLRPRVGKDVRRYTFGRHSGDFHSTNERFGNGTIVFDFVHPDGLITDIELGVPVDVNVDNAIAALAAIWLTGTLTPELARTAIASYPGVERRFERRWCEDGERGRVIIDDYAHHPREVARSIASVRAVYPGRHITAAFQPHLYSRTRDFAPEFAQALSQADAVVLADIYPARELPIEGVTSKIIFDDIKCADKVMILKEDFVKTMKNRNFDILLTLGAGDLNLQIAPLIAAMTE